MTRRGMGIAVAGLAVTSLFSAPLHAQTPVSFTIFAEAAVASDVGDVRLGPAGTTMAGGFAVGFGSTRSTVQLEIDLPQWHRSSTTTGPYIFAGNTSGYEQHGHSYIDTVGTAQRSISYAVLYGRHIPVGRHVQVTWLIGGAQVSRPWQQTRVTNEVSSDGRQTVVNTSRYSSSDDKPAAIVGFEAELTIVRHVSIVPGARLVVYPLAGLDDGGDGPRNMIPRAQMAVRWRF